jgi:serine/threonine-protein kinase RsbW
MSQPVRRLRVPADLDRLADVRRLVREGATDAGAPQGVVDDLVQGVDEAATNAITHGYAGRAGWVEVALAVKGTDLVVTIEDEAPVFDPTSRPEPDMSVSPLVRGPHGMGIHLMRLATDAIAHRPRDGGGNIVTLTRSLVAQPEEDR